jgi:hypothetical protein
MVVPRHAWFLGGMLAGVVLASPLFLRAQTASPADPSPVQANAAGEPRPWWKGIAADGYLSFSYSYNPDDPIPRINQFRVFDFNANDPQLDVAQLVIQRPVSESKQFGFKLNIMAGSGVPEVTAAYGLFRDTQSGVAHHFDIPELYASYIVPVGKGLRLDAGKFATHLGYEVIGGYDGYNDNVSRSFLFGYGIPFTHTGVKAGYSFSRRVSAALLVTNGSDAVTRLNGGVTVGGQVAVTITKTASITFNCLHGPERPHNGHDQRSQYELTGSWKMAPRLTLGFDGLYADEDHAASSGKDAIWKGLVGYSKFSFTKRSSLAFRGEVFRDGGGSRTGVDQTLRGFALTPEYDLPARLSRLNSRFKRIDGQFAIRGELRKDLSDQASFRKGTGFTDQQFTTAVNLIYLF